jgi:tetratricopeptide (TPR) repeat protein
MRLRSAFLAIVSALILSSPSKAFCQDKPDALELYRSGKYADAIVVCRQELQETPNNIDSHVVLVWSCLKLKKYSEALDVGRKALEIAPNDPRLIEVIGESLLFLGKLDDALKNLEEYVALRPSGGRIARVYWLMGECYIGLREYQNADIAVSTALYYEQNNAAWWARLGYVREMANDLKGSEEAYSRALTLDPNMTDALRGKERVDKKLGD